MPHFFADNHTLQDIASRFGTPFYLYDEKGIRQAARRLQQAFSWNTGFREFFAVKANPNPYLLRLLQEEGCGVDCSSLTELMLARACGFKPEEIMLSANVTPAEDFRLARGLGACVNLDDISHIAFLEECAGLGKSLSLRFNPGMGWDIHNAIMDNPAQAKYGLTRSQLGEACHILRSKGITRIGLHAFLASNNLVDQYYPSLARLLFRTAVELREETGMEISFVNLSGGIGIPYHPGQSEAPIARIGEAIHEAYDEILVEAGMKDVRIHTELGRYMLGPYGHLVARAIHRKEIHKTYVGLDSCAADLMRPAMYGAYHHIHVAGKEEEPCTETVDVTGGLCENNVTVRRTAYSFSRSAKV